MRSCARALLVWLVISAWGCANVATMVSYDHRRPRGELEVDHGADGRWLGVIPEAAGGEVRELPDGDVLLAGYAEPTFVSRLSAAEGEEKWSLPLSGCGPVRLALGDDGTIYVGIRDLRALPRAVRERAADRRERCERSSLSAPTAIVRLNGRGEVLWRADVSSGGSEPPLLLATAARLLVVGYDSQDNVTTSRSTLRSYTAGGQLAWTKAYDWPVPVEAWTHAGSTVLMAGRRSNGKSCTLRALDVRTGNVEWERALDEDFDEGRPCVPRERSFARLTPPELGMLVRYGSSQRLESERDPVLLGVDPQGGRTVPIASFEETVPGLVAEGAYVSASSWGHHALLVSGSFIASLKVLEMEVETNPAYGTSCQSIDSGFNIGPSNVDRSKRDVSPMLSDGLCPKNTYEQRTRTYDSALFVARFPLASLAKARSLLGW